MIAADHYLPVDATAIPNDPCVSARTALAGGVGALAVFTALCMAGLVTLAVPERALTTAEALALATRIHPLWFLVVAGALGALGVS